MAIDKTQLNRKAKLHAALASDHIEDQQIKTLLEQQCIETWKAGYLTCHDEMTPKFDKTFESLYKISMTMADTCIGNKGFEKRFEKLEEEYHELIAAFEAFLKLPTNAPGGEYMETLDDLLCEAGDVLFVLLHIAHRLQPGITAFTLLHGATLKMLARMNDATYTAKN